MKRDTIVGLVGAAILLVALVGVFRYESATGPAGPAYALAAPRALGNFTGSASPGQAYTIPVAIPAGNWTKLDFDLEASGGPFNLSVKDPNGTEHAATGNGPVHVVVDLAPLPANGTGAPEPRAASTWTVVVTLQSSSQVPTPPTALPLPGNTVDFKLVPYGTEFATS